MKTNQQDTYDLREKDWRNGAIVYQVLVDRFAPPANIDSKKELYQKPKVLKKWSDIPESGIFLEADKYWAHELEYWGGDLKSLLTKLSYLKNLDIDVLYLNPIFESLSNHKYDATNYLKISSEYGTKEDLSILTNKLHELGIKVVLDGVFNHVGVQNDLYVKAKNHDPNYRHWFDFNEKYPEGVRLWADAKSLPELNLEHEDVKQYIYKAEDSVLKTYLKLGIDGWRLDVAFDLGYDILKDLTTEAHKEKEGSLIVGEIWNYPQKWLTSIDAVMNFTLREIIYRSIRNQISAKNGLQMITKMIDDAGIEGILKSWNVLDNHDVKRLKNEFNDERDQKIAQLLQFTLPGSPNLYYGTELGMQGADDPKNRAPMRWDLLKDDNQCYGWIKKLVALHHQHRALKIGDFKALMGDTLFGFERYTNKVEDSIFVIINLTDHEVEDSLLVPNSDIMNYSSFNILLGEEPKVELIAGLLKVQLKSKSFMVIKPNVKAEKSYSPYKRIIGKAS